MSGILRKLSTPALVEAIEANLFAFYPLFALWPQIEIHDEDSLLWSISDIPFPMFNSVVRSRLADRELGEVIETAKERCKARNVPMLWWTGPATRPTDLGAHLVARGFASSGELPGMAVDLQAVDDNLPVPAGFTVEPVTNRDGLRQWCDVLSAGFGMPTFVGDAFFEFHASLGMGEDVAYSSYLGRLDGKPVASSSMLLGAGVAGIYNVATIPEARRRGLGAAMTIAPLQLAREQGYRAGILHSSPMGENVYGRLGFIEYCKLGQYVWPAESEESAAG